MSEIVEFIRARLDEDEQWGRAASEPYRWADAGSHAPPGGVHWQWVIGDDWRPVKPDPVISEYIGDDGDGACWLQTVETWPTTVKIYEASTETSTSHFPRSYSQAIDEMSAAAAGHIARHDPARVLREVAAKRAILAYGRAGILNALAAVWSDHPEYRAEWRLDDGSDQVQR